MVEILRSRDQTGPLWWRFSSAIVALYSLVAILNWLTDIVLKGYLKGKTGKSGFRLGTVPPEKLIRSFHNLDLSET